MSEKLTIIIDAKDQASAALKAVAGNTKSIGDAAKKAGIETEGGFGRAATAIKPYEDGIRSASIAMVALGAATVAMAGKSIAAFRTQEVAEAKLRSAIRGTAQAIDQSRLEKLAADLQKVTTFGDEASIAMMAMLVSFNLTQDKVESLAPRIQNIAAFMGIDMQSAAIAVGKAIAMNSATALNRFGVIIDEAAMKSGNFNDILQSIDRNTGPAAEELAKGAGAAEQLKNEIGDLQESIGGALLPGLRLVTAVAKPVVAVFKAIADSPIGKVLIPIGTAGGIAAGGLGMIGLAAPAVIRGLAAIEAALIKVGITSRATAATVGASATQMAASTTAAGAAAGGGGAAARGILAGGTLAAGGRLAMRAGPYGLAAGAAYSVVNAPRLGAQSAAATGATGWGGLRQRLGLLTSAEYAALEGGAAAAGAESPEEMAAWRSQMQQAQGLAGPEAAPLAEEQLALEPAIEQLAELAAAAPAPSRSAPGMTQVGAGSWFLPGPSSAAAGTIGNLRSREIGPNRYEIIFEVIPNIPAGVYDEHTSEWMDDLAWAGAS
ncbi:MAG TPA: hypothetical protein VMY87_12280 [Armatimonadota bacterium]|nr:hypothetical protein [Armatimonadota bacterium]